MLDKRVSIVSLILIYLIDWSWCVKRIDLDVQITPYGNLQYYQFCPLSIKLISSNFSVQDNATNYKLFRFGILSSTNGSVTRNRGDVHIQREIGGYYKPTTGKIQPVGTNNYIVMDDGLSIYYVQTPKYLNLFSYEFHYDWEESIYYWALVIPNDMNHRIQYNSTHYYYHFITDRTLLMPDQNWNRDVPASITFNLTIPRTYENVSDYKVLNETVYVNFQSFKTLEYPFVKKVYMNPIIYSNGTWPGQNFTHWKYSADLVEHTTFTIKQSWMNRLSFVVQPELQKHFNSIYALYVYFEYAVGVTVNFDTCWAITTRRTIGTDYYTTNTNSSISCSYSIVNSASNVQATIIFPTNAVSTQPEIGYHTYPDTGFDYLSSWRSNFSFQINFTYYGTYKMYYKIISASDYARSFTDYYQTYLEQSGSNRYLIFDNYKDPVIINVVKYATFTALDIDTRINSYYITVNPLDQYVMLVALPVIVPTTPTTTTTTTTPTSLIKKYTKGDPDIKNSGLPGSFTQSYAYLIDQLLNYSTTMSYMKGFLQISLLVFILQNFISDWVLMSLYYFTPTTPYFVKYVLLIMWQSYNNSLYSVFGIDTPDLPQLNSNPSTKDYGDVTISNDFLSFMFDPFTTLAISIVTCVIFTTLRKVLQLITGLIFKKKVKASILKFQWFETLSDIFIELLPVLFLPSKSFLYNPNFYDYLSKVNLMLFSAMAGAGVIFPFFYFSKLVREGQGQKKMGWKLLFKSLASKKGKNILNQIGPKRKQINNFAVLQQIMQTVQKPKQPFFDRIVRVLSPKCQQIQSSIVCFLHITLPITVTMQNQTPFFAINGVLIVFCFLNSQLFSKRRLNMGARKSYMLIFHFCFVIMSLTQGMNFYMAGMVSVLIIVVALFHDVMETLYNIIQILISIVMYLRERNRVKNDFENQNKDEQKQKQQQQKQKQGEIIEDKDQTFEKDNVNKPKKKLNKKFSKDKLKDKLNINESNIEETKYNIDETNLEIQQVSIEKNINKESGDFPASIEPMSVYKDKNARKRQKNIDKKLKQSNNQQFEQSQPDDGNLVGIQDEQFEIAQASKDIVKKDKKNKKINNKKYAK